MKVKVIAKKMRETSGELLVVPVSKNAGLKSENIKALPAPLQQAAKKVAAKREIKFKFGEAFTLDAPRGIKYDAALFVGTGADKKLTDYNIRVLAAKAVKEAKKLKCAKINFAMPQAKNGANDKSWVYHLAVGAQLSGYDFDKYLNAKKRKGAFKVNEFNIISGGVKNAGAILRRAAAVADGVTAARDVTNEPGTSLYPQKLAEFARKTARGIENLSVAVWDEKRLLKEKMRLLYEVGKGSVHKPRFIIMTYTPPKKGVQKRKVVLVGKGLTFDSGGINLKPSAGGMLDLMKLDKGGGAAIVGAMAAIARLKPAFTVIGLIPSAENANDGGSYLPGDIITGRKGVSVEVNNTDAEGRLILADALAYGCELKPTEVIDTATLTGACMVALGQYTSGLLTESDKMAADLQAASERATEDIWRLPMNERVGEGLKSQNADTKNSGGRFGGAISAALFLKKFTDPSFKWAHLDIAGPAFTTKAYDFFSYGGTGVITETLIEYIAPNKLI